MSRKPHIYWATHAFIINENNQLLLQERQNTWYYDWGWQVPAGHIDDWETAIESMRHECLEELWIIIDIDESNVFHIIHRINKYRQYFDIGVILTKRSWEIINNEPEKCSAIDRFALDNLPEYISPSTIRFIEAYKSKEFYSEFRE